MGRIDRRFDLIEAVGVLHHLADPPAGWRVLLSLLKPDGMMRIGLYSPLARRDLDAARIELRARDFAPTPAGVRAAREHLMGMPDFDEVVRRPDFFSVSSCRDLLFHVQETSMPLPAIAAFLREHGLKVRGMDLDAPVLPMTWRHYLKMKPSFAGRALTKLMAFEAALGVGATFKLGEQNSTLDATTRTSD